jgi:hypothetical protein
MLPHYYELMTVLNEAAKDDELKYYDKFLYFNADGLPSGRPFSYLNNRLNPDKKHREDGGARESRPEFFARMGIPDYREVYDIKSQYPRVNCLFNTGEWKPDSYDFYTKIVEDTGMLESDGETVPKNPPEDGDEADCMKHIFMRIYNGKGSFKQSYLGWICDKKKRILQAKEEGIYTDCDSIIRALDGMAKFGGGGGIDLETWELLCLSTERVIGPFIGNLVAWYSFFIETEVKIELLNRGKVVYNVYDGFYYDEDIRLEIGRLVAEKAKYVYEKYMKPGAKA